MLKTKSETLKFGLGFGIILLLILSTLYFYFSINISFFIFLIPIMILIVSIFFKSPIIIFHYFIELIFIRLIPKLINKIIIFCVFYLFFTPLSLIFNFFGFSKGFLVYKSKNSYWVKSDLDDNNFNEPF